VKRPLIASLDDPGRTIDLDTCMDELQREYQVRLRCYDRWVTEGKLSYSDARDRHQRLRAAIAHLAAIAGPPADTEDPVTSSGDDPVPF
jgi:hypothetical protein